MNPLRVRVRSRPPPTMYVVRRDATRAGRAPGVGAPVRES